MDLQAGTDTSRVPDSALGAATSTVREVLEKAESTPGVASGKVQQVISHPPRTARDPLYDAVHSASAAAGTLEERSGDRKQTQQQLLQASTAYVRAHPLQSAAAALAAGWLIGRITR